MIQLREYQKEPIRKAIEYLRSESSTPSLIVLPTSWGKSILTAFAARHMNPEDRLLVVQPSKELLEQNHGKYVSLCNSEENAGIYSASFGRKQIERITYATIGSIKDKGEEFRQAGFTKMLIDEAHLYPRKEQSMLGKFLKDSGIRQVLGITATPLKLESFQEKQGDHFDKWSELIMLTNPAPSGTFFKQILHVGQIQEMTKLGFWSPLIYEQIPFDTSQLQWNSTGTEFSKNSTEQAYIQNNIRESIFDALDRHRERNHCVVYVPSILEAAILADEYPDSAYISGETPKKERERTINDFRNGKIRVCFNVGVLQVGFDFPEIDLLLLAFATASVAKYYQIIGRGVRIHPDKKDCLVVDMGGNTERFGKAEDIIFKQGEKWRMYGTNGILLTGLPIQAMGYVTRYDVNRIRIGIRDGHATADTIWSFGKYKGRPYATTPMMYRTWALTHLNLQQTARDGIILSIEDHIRDTRNDPPAVTMPDGMHAGKPISEVSRRYLVWYYRSKEWNETNDSLKRALEQHLGQKITNRTAHPSKPTCRGFSPA